MARKKRKKKGPKSLKACVGRPAKASTVDKARARAAKAELRAKKAQAQAELAREKYEHTKKCEALRKQMRS